MPNAEKSAGAAAVMVGLDGGRWVTATMYALAAVLWLLYALRNQVLVDRDGVVVRYVWGRRYYPAVELTEQVTARKVRIRPRGRRRAVLSLPRNPSRWRLWGVRIRPAHVADPTRTIRALLAWSDSDADADRDATKP